MKKDLRGKSYNEVMNEWAAQKSFLARAGGGLFSAGPGRRVLGWLIRVFCFIVIPLLGYGFLLRLHLRSEGFSKEVEGQMARWLESPGLRTRGASMDLDGEFRAAEVSGAGGPDAVFQQIRVNALSGHLPVAGFFRKDWHFRQLSAFSLAAVLRSGGMGSVPPPSEKKTAAAAHPAILTAGWGVNPDFSQLTFDRFATMRLSLVWGGSPASAGHLDECSINASRSGDGWDVALWRGTFGQGWLDGLGLENAKLRIAPDRAVIDKAELTLPRGGTGTLTGAIVFGERPDITASVALKDAALPAFLPAPFSDHTPVRCDGTVEFSGSTNRVEGVTARAELALRSGTIQGLPVLRALEIVSGEQRFAQPEVTGGVIRFTAGGSAETGGYVIDCTDTTVECGAILRLKLRGRHERQLLRADPADPNSPLQLVVGNAGTLAIGITPEMAARLRPAVRETFFAKEDAGMLWLEVPFQGDGTALTRQTADLMIAVHDGRNR